MELEAIQRIKLYINKHLQEDFTLLSLASDMGYSPYHLSKCFKAATGQSVMEYARLCRIAAASSDIARGGSICDSAMKHCFGTHAGFTRAFVSVIGCPPKFYKELNMNIKIASTPEELREVLDFTKNEFINEYGDSFHIAEPGTKYSLEFWEQQQRINPTLLLYSESGGIITGSAFGWVDGDCVTAAHCCVTKDKRREGIGRVLMYELEKSTLALGYHGIALGSLDTAVEFYEKLGYFAAILIQSQKDSVEDLLRLSEGYEVIYTSIYEEYIYQVSLRAAPSEVKKIREKYASVYPESYVQVVMGKNF